SPSSTRALLLKKSRRKKPQPAKCLPQRTRRKTRAASNRCPFLPSSPCPRTDDKMAIGQDIRLVVGLGNPGADYVSTRHNAGFWFVDELARRAGVPFKPEKKFHGEMARVQIGGQDVRLLKPMTYMNRSGLAVRAAADFLKISVGEILVAHDEID